MNGSRALLQRLSGARITQVLAKPTWSVHSLLEVEPHETIEPPTPTLLNRLLKQSALEAAGEGSPRQQALLKEMTNQLAFITHIHTVDTKGLEPLVRIGDETPLDFDLSDTEEKESAFDWKPTDLASKKDGIYYVLERS